MNALCAGACFDNKAGRDRSHTIEVDDVYAAREDLILARRTHLDQLAHKLEVARVRRVVEPILSGGEVRHDGRDLEYARDLGLIAPDSPPCIANPIYAEVVPRELGYVLQDSLPGCCINRRIRYSSDQTGSRLRESPSLPRLHPRGQAPRKHVLAEAGAGIQGFRD